MQRPYRVMLPGRNERLTNDKGGSIYLNPWSDITDHELRVLVLQIGKGPDAPLHPDVKRHFEDE